MSREHTTKRYKSTLTTYERDLLYRVERFGYEVLTVCLADQSRRKSKTQNSITTMTPTNETIKTRKIG